MSVLLKLWQWAGPRILLALGVVGLVLTALFSARRAGQKAEQVATLKQTIKATRQKHETDTTVSRLPDGAAADQLRQWRRD